MSRCLPLRQTFVKSDADRAPFSRFAFEHLGAPAGKNNRTTDPIAGSTAAQAGKPQYLMQGDSANPIDALDDFDRWEEEAV